MRICLIATEMSVCLTVLAGQCSKWLIVRGGMILAPVMHMIRFLASTVLLALVLLEASADAPNVNALVLLGIGLLLLALTRQGTAG